MKQPRLLTLCPAPAICAVAFLWFALSASAEEAPLRIGYSFNEGSAAGGAPVTDFYGNRDGTYVGTWNVDGDGTHYFREGFSGEPGDTSVVFGGNRVNADLGAALDGSWESFTFEVNLFLGEDTGSWSRALHMLGGPSLALRSSNRDQIRFSGMESSIDVDVPADEWFHVAWVYDDDDGEVRVYINGELRGSGALDPALESPGTLVIGTTDVGGSAWGTPLDDFRFTHAALSPEQFLVDGFGPYLTDPDDAEPPAEPSIEIGYSFNEGSAEGGSPLTDFYGHHDGTYTGTWTVDDDPTYYFRDGFSGEPGDTSVVFGGNRATTDLDEALGGSWESFTFEVNLFLGEDTGSWSRALHMLGGPSLVQRRGSLDALRIGGTTSDIDIDVPADEWFHLAWVYDADSEAVTVYINGTARGSGEIDPAMSSPGTLVIGATDVGGSPWGTPLDDFRFSDVALSPSQFLFDGFGPDLTAPGIDGTFDEWRTAYFSAEELDDESISGPGASPAGDGVANLLKYAMGLGDPKIPARHALPQADIVGGELQLTFPRAKGAEDVELIAAFSSDLLTWESGENVVEVVGTVDDGDVEWITVRVTAPVSEMDRAFMRLQATLF